MRSPVRWPCGVRRSAPNQHEAMISLPKVFSDRPNSSMLKVLWRVLYPVLYASEGRNRRENQGRQQGGQPRVLVRARRLRSAATCAAAARPLPARPPLDHSMCGRRPTGPESAVGAPCQPVLKLHSRGRRSKAHISSCRSHRRATPLVRPFPPFRLFYSPGGTFALSGRPAGRQP